MQNAVFITEWLRLLIYVAVDGSVKNGISKNDKEDSMDSILRILWFLMEAFVVPLISVLFFCSVQKPRINKWIFPLVVLSVSFVGHLLIFKAILVNRAVFTLVYNTVLILSVFFLFKDKAAKKTLNLLICFLLILSFDYIAYIASLPLAAVLADNVLKCVALLFCIVMLSLSFTFAANFLNKRNVREIDKKSFAFLLIPLSHVATYFVTSLYEIRNSPYTEVAGEELKSKMVFSAALMFCLLFSLLIDIFAFNQYVKSLDAAKLKSENEALEYRNKLNEQYFEDLKENELEFRKVKHDIGGSLQIVKELIYEEKDVDKAKGLFDALSQTVQSINTGFYCHNSLINAILTNKAKQSKKENIDFEADISVPDVSPIDESDLCRILVNILDNAIEANAGLQRERFVRVRIKTSETYLFIRTENPSGGRGFNQSTKSDKTGHGYGLRILNDFSKKYDGAFTIGEKDCVTTAQITLRIQK